MHLRHGLSAAIIGTSIAIVQSYSQNVSALTAPEVSKIAKQVTVRIEFQVEGRKAQGSGFIVKKSSNIYHVVTAYHVVAAETNYTLIAPDGERYNIERQKVIYKEGTDLAVVQFTSSKTYQIAKVGNSDNSPEGTTVYVAGFPARTSTVTSSELYRFLPGQVSANASQPLDEGYSLVYTNPTLGGMSGGPVFNEQGEVVAIHGKAETQALVSGDGIKVIGSGNNLGISVNTFLRLALLDVGVNLPTLQVAQAPKADDFYLKGTDLSQKKDYRRAAEAFARAIKINPKLARAYYSRGYAYYELKDYDKALRDYDRAIALNPKLVPAYHNRGTTYYRLKEYQRALSDYNQAIAMEPEEARFYYNRAAVHVQLKQYEQALADTNQAISLDRKLAPAYINRAAINYELRQYEQALADTNQAISLDRKSAPVYINRGIVLYKLQQYEEALVDLTKAISLKSEFTFAAYTNRGFVYYELGRVDDAISDWRKALRFDSQIADPKLGLGVALYSQGKQDEGLQHWKHGIKLLGKTPDLQFLTSERNWNQIILNDAAQLLQDPRL